MKQRLGYLYLHAPHPEKRGQYVTHRIAVELDDEHQDADEPDDEEADNASA